MIDPRPLPWRPDSIDVSTSVYLYHDALPQWDRQADALLFWCARDGGRWQIGIEGLAPVGGQVRLYVPAAVDGRPCSLLGPLLPAVYVPSSGASC